jgi:hypothetical protein
VPAKLLALSDEVINRWLSQKTYVLCRKLRRSSAAVATSRGWAAQDFRSAKGLFVPSLKRDIVPSIA